MNSPKAIGIFDSGYGGLTVLREIRAHLPQYDYIYLGDNARAPYGNRSFETVHRYTLEAVKWFFSQGCSLVILACNTASAKALRTIQQNDLGTMETGKKVLGVIRPTTEVIGKFSRSGKVGILATSGTVQSGSYPIEIEKFYPGIKVYQQACPMWVPLIENHEMDNTGADYFVIKYLNALLEQDRDIDSILLGCTHYPLLRKKILQWLPGDIQLISQGEIVASSLGDYLQRHPEIDQNCAKNGQTSFYTTDSCDDFDLQATFFYGESVRSTHADP